MWAVDLHKLQGLQEGVLRCHWRALLPTLWYRKEGGDGNPNSDLSCREVTSVVGYFRMVDALHTSSGCLSRSQFFFV